MSELMYIPLNDSHAESMLPIWSDEDVIKFTNIQLPCTLQEVRDRITLLKQYDVFVVLQNEAVIGIVGCPCLDKERAEYGLFYQFYKSAWGKGVATTATRWLLEFMERKYPNLSLFADVVIDNIASERILNKFGFSLVSEEPFERNGVTNTIHRYALRA